MTNDQKSGYKYLYYLIVGCSAVCAVLALLQWGIVPFLFVVVAFIGGFLLAAISVSFGVEDGKIKFRS